MANVTKINVEERDYTISTDASLISYDSIKSGIASKNLQDAIDEVSKNIDKIDEVFVQNEHFVNLISGYSLYGSNPADKAGGLMVNPEWSACEDFIPVDSEVSISITISSVSFNASGIGKRYYDENKSYLSTSYTSDARYFRFCYHDDTVDDVIITINGIEYNNKKYKEIVNKDDFDVLTARVDTYDESIDEIRQDFDSINKIIERNENYVKLVSGYIITGDYGIISERDNCAATESYISISTEPTISLLVAASSKNVNKRFYDENKVYLGATYTDSAKYVRFWYDSPEIENISITINGVLYSTTQEFKEFALKEDIYDLDTEIENKVASDELFNISSVNMMNPALATFDRRYNGTTSSGTYGKIIANTSYAGSGMIEVKEGNTYTISGDGFYYNGSMPRGGYFDASATGAVGDMNIEPIEFYSPSMGIGKCFTVPQGIGVKYVNFLMTANSDRTAWGGNAMMNEGELAAEYQEYNLTKKIKSELIPGNDGSDSGSASDLITQWLTTPSRYDYGDVSSKLSNFRMHYMLKDKDLVVLNTGTSLTASSNQNNSVTLYGDAAYRPPLLQGKNFMSLFWNKLAWSNQYYRRYDAKIEKDGDVNMFIENGTFALCSTYLPDWDLGGSFRPCFMRYADVSSSNASIEFAIPEYANQFNFIHVTDQKGAQQCTISITEGNGYMEVYNGSSWVEANGYVFSERESAEVYLDSVSYVNPSNGSNATINNYQVKGNFTYQKRLKMRSVANHISDEKHMTITATQESNARFMYWGVEWSLRPYMITLINAARGSHNPLISNTVSEGISMRQLNHYQDNEVWSFKPDLIFTENPIINAGSSGPERAGYTTEYWGRVTENFFFADNQLSMKARAKTLYGQDYSNSLEWVIFNTSPSYYHSVKTDGTKEEMCEMNPSGDYLTWLDANERAHLHLTTNHPEVVAINAARFWRESAIFLYGNVYDSVVGTNATSTASFSVDGTHWNELGNKIMAKVILPVLDFVN